MILGKKRIASAAFILVAILFNVYLCLAYDYSFGWKFLLCALVDAMALFCVTQVETLLRVPFDIYLDRTLFTDLVKNDFQAKFAGSYLGIFWAFVNPIITMILYWFVFQVGLRAGNISDYPFILFLMSGLIPWFYFSESLNGATNVLMEYSYLVKKVVFNVGILPVIKVASALFVHVFFLLILFVFTSIYGYYPDWYCLQVLYYVFCMALLVLAISYVTAACTAFFKDMTQIVNIVLTIGVWVSPIMWNPATLSPELSFVFRINPLYYVIDGFRDAMLAKVWFWEKPLWTIYFWMFTLMLYIVGVKLFNRLKPHFSDVL